LTKFTRETPDPNDAVVHIDPTTSEADVTVEGKGSGTATGLTGRIAFSRGVCPAQTCRLDIDFIEIYFPNFPIGDSIVMERLRVFGGGAPGQVARTGQFTITRGNLRLFGSGKLKIKWAPDNEGRFEFSNKGDIAGTIGFPSRVFTVEGIIEDTVDGRDVTVDLKIHGTFPGPIPPAVDVTPLAQLECQGPDGAAFTAQGSVQDPDGVVVFQGWALDRELVSTESSISGSLTFGWHLLELYAVDDQNLWGSRRRLLNVVDTTPPVPDVEPLPDITVATECPPISFVPTATDLCTGPVTGTTESPLTFTEPGTSGIAWAYDDANGNVAQQRQTVVVVEPHPPIPDVSDLPPIVEQCRVEVAGFPTATDACGNTVVGTTDDPLVYEEQGTFEITWTYDDGRGNTSQQTQQVVIRDTIPPTIAEFLYGGPACLWPPNHDYVVLRVGRDFQALIEDNCDPNPRLVITTARSSQPDDAQGDGNATDDLVVFEDRLCLRRERQGGVQTGRLYDVELAAVDFVGNASDPNVQIRVFHDQRPSTTCPQLAAAEIVTDQDPTCRPIAPTSADETKSSTNTFSCAQSNGTFWATLLVLLLLATMRSRRRLLALVLVLASACGETTGSHGPTNGVAQPSNAIALPATLDVRAFTMVEPNLVFLCGESRDTGLYELRAYTRSGTTLATLSSFGIAGAIRPAASHQALAWFTMCAGLAAMPGPYVALWTQQGGVVVNLSGEVIAELSGVGGAMATGGAHLLEIMPSAPGTLVRELEINSVDEVFETAAIMVPEVVWPVAGDLAEGLFAGAVIASGGASPVPTVIAYNAAGIERFRISDTDTIGNAEHGHCAVTDLWLSTSGTLFTLDVSCHGVRSYDSASGTFIEQVSIPTGNVKRIASSWAEASEPALLVDVQEEQILMLPE